ncbi:50S ribosomal protein L10 [Candidatus Daviesbacteria bacterium]|nr:50S ribosomal protein L10 [Candidatus Daviesbacteria bacterium]
MAKTRQQKQDLVIKLQEKLAKAKAVVFTDYKGLTMKQLSDLRNKLREQSAEFSITKNTLLERALPASSLQLPTSNLEGPTAALFAYDDEISPIKILVKILKDASLGKVKSGFLGKDSLDEAKIIQLSTLPSKPELRAKTVGVLVAPLQGIVGVLQANLRNLVYALSEIQKMKGGDTQASS